MVKWWEDILGRRNSDTWKKIKDNFAKCYHNIKVMHGQPQAIQAVSPLQPLTDGHPAGADSQSASAIPADGSETPKKKQPSEEELATQPLGLLESALEGILDNPAADGHPGDGRGEGNQ